MSTMGDLDPTETGEWVDALSAVQQHRGSERTNYLINRLVDLSYGFLDPKVRYR